MQTDRWKDEQTNGQYEKTYISLQHTLCACGISEADKIVDG